jgi:hypothetical protein
MIGIHYIVNHGLAGGDEFLLCNPVPCPTPDPHEKASKANCNAEHRPRKITRRSTIEDHDETRHSQDEEQNHQELKEFQLFQRFPDLANLGFQHIFINVMHIQVDFQVF